MSEKSLALRVAPFAAIVALAPLLLSQAFYGCFGGTVTDPSSAALVVGTATLTSVGTGSHWSKSGAGSDYRFLNLISGTYRVGANPQVTSDVPDVTENPLSRARLKYGIQPRGETSTSTLGDL